MNLENNEDLRVCSVCGKVMNKGYVVDSGMEYYCSDECLLTKYTNDEWNEMYDNGNSDSYYTEWEDDIVEEIEDND